MTVSVSNNASNGVYSNSHPNGITHTSATTTAAEHDQKSAGGGPKKQRFEAYMMTGDLILNLSRTQQSSGLIPAHAKKVDSLRDSPKQQRNGTSRIAARNGSAAASSGFAPRARGESSLSSPSFSDDSSDSINSVRKLPPDNTRQSPSKIPSGGGQSRVGDANDFVLRGESDSSSGNSRYGAGADFSGDLVTKDSSTSRSALIMNKRDPHHQHHNHHPHSNNSDTSNNSANGARHLPRSATQRNAVDTPGVDPEDLDDDPSFGSSTAARSDNLDSPDACYSVPTSPTSLTTPVAEALSSVKQRDTANSAPTSPESGAQDILLRRSQQQQQQQQQQFNGIAGGSSGGAAGSVNRRNDAAGFRTSRSEDHLQHTQRDILGTAIPIDIDEDVNSSLNTLLDTRQDSEDSQVNIAFIIGPNMFFNHALVRICTYFPFYTPQSSSDRDRIVWTYNAPVHPATAQQTHHSSSSSHSHSSSISSSPQRSDSPASPTSVSSSIMSSNSGSKAGGATNGGGGGGNGGGSSNNSGARGGGDGSNTLSGATIQSLMCPINNGDHSVSEAVSNISSPDYQDDDNLLSSKDMAGMAISDPSDSDSTILVSDAGHHHHQRDQDRDHKIVIRVKGLEGSSAAAHAGYAELRDSEDELATITEDVATVMAFGLGPNSHADRDSSPPVSDDGSDVDSLHSYHYSPKAVDIPSAVRLSKRLYSLDGFKKSDVSRHLSKKLVDFLYI